MSGFVIKDRFGNLIGLFDTAGAAAKWARAEWPDQTDDDWQYEPVRAPDTV